MNKSTNDQSHMCVTRSRFDDELEWTGRVPEPDGSRRRPYHVTALPVGTEALAELAADAERTMNNAHPFMVKGLMKEKMLETRISNPVFDVTLTLDRPGVQYRLTVPGNEFHEVNLQQRPHRDGKWGKPQTLQHCLGIRMIHITEALGHYQDRGDEAGNLLKGIINDVPSDDEGILDRIRMQARIQRLSERIDRQHPRHEKAYKLRLGNGDMELVNYILLCAANDEARGDDEPDMRQTAETLRSGTEELYSIMEWNPTKATWRWLTLPMPADIALELLREATGESNHEAEPSGVEDEEYEGWAEG